MDKGKATFLVLVVDVDSLLCSALSKTVNGDMNTASTAIDSILKSLAIFCNCYALMHRQNEVAVIGVLSDSAQIIFPSSNSSSSASSASGGVSVGDYQYVPLLHTLSEQVTTGLRQATEAQISGYKARNAEDRGCMSQALSCALCMMNRHKKLQSRLLIVQFERDRNQNYNALMNSIFSAQKMNVLVDSLVLSSFDSHILQQASFLTGGLYMKHGEPGELLQVLLMHYLADNTTRKHLAVPQQKSVDFKASCHCHKRPVEFAFMCSVCLTLSCAAGDSCEVCGTAARTSTTLTK